MTESGTGTRGLGQKMWDLGLGGVGRGDQDTLDEKTLGLWTGTKRLEDVLSRKVLYARGFVTRPVTDDFQPLWFGLTCLLAYFTVRALDTE